MKFTSKQMVEETLIRIEQIQAHIGAIEAAVRYLNHRNRHGNIDCGTLRSSLIQEELKEWQNLFMWGMTLDGAERDRIKAAGYQRFLRDGMHVAQWMNDGVSPTHWLEADDAEFRAMARKAFAPKVR